MKEREMYVIFNRVERTYATRKAFTPEFTNCRIYKERFHAENVVNHKFQRCKEDLCIVPIKMTMDPHDEFAALLGNGSL